MCVTAFRLCHADVKAFSLDLRERAVALCDADELKRVEIARLLGVSTDWLHKLLRQRCLLGHLAPLAHGGGRPALLSEVDLAALRAAWATQPDASLEELAATLRAAGAPASTGTTVVHRACKALGLTRKKRRSGRRRPTSRSAKASAIS